MYEGVTENWRRNQQRDGRGIFFRHLGVVDNY